MRFVNITSLMKVMDAETEQARKVNKALHEENELLRDVLTRMTIGAGDDAVEIAFLASTAEVLERQMEHTDWWVEVALAKVRALPCSCGVEAMLEKALDRSAPEHGGEA